jgi:hypothetical protein
VGFGIEWNNSKEDDEEGVKWDKLTASLSTLYRVHY